MILSLVVFIFLAGMLSAQEEPIQINRDTVRIRLPRVIKSIDDTTEADNQSLFENQPDEVDRAQRLMRFGEYRQAARILEEYLGHGPLTPVVQDLLIQCYEQSKEYDKLLTFLKRRLEIAPPSFAVYRDLGKVYIAAGMPDSAVAYFFEAIRHGTDKERAYSMVADIYYQSGLYDLEKGLIDSARVLTGDSTFMSGKMGDALTARQEFAAATLEYLRYMEKDSVAARIGEERIISLMRFPESVDTVMAILAEQISLQAETEQLQKIYGQMLMEQDRFDEAFEFFCRQDSLSDRNGVEILIFMQECNRRRRFEHALEGGEYFLRRHSRSSLKNSVNFFIAEAYIGTGKYIEALETYEAIADDFIRPAHRAEANLSIGLLYKNYLGDLDKAKEYLNLVTTTVPGGSYAVQAEQALADIAIGEHQLDTAISRFQSLLELELPPEVAERIEFTLAETFLFMEEYNEAATRFRQIISRYPRGFYVNDAIQYSLIINEALDEAPQQIDLFSSAEYFRYTDQPDSLEYYLLKICRVGIPSLAPISYVHLARLYAERQRYEEAVSAVDSLVRLYPDSYYLPYGLKLKADIFMESPENRDRAMELYRGLLSEYPTYPFAAEIRDIIRREFPPDRS